MKTSNLARRSAHTGVIVAVLLAMPVSSQAQLRLHTPIDHYETFDANRAELSLLNAVLSELDPQSQILVQQFLAPREEGTTPPVPRSQARAFLRSLDLEPWRAEILDLLVHRSSVLAVVPDDASHWIPVVHDSLLFFLDRLGEERLFDRILNLIYLPAGAPRGDRLLQFAHRTPTLQKIGQILARNPALSPDLREALQTLENGIATSDPDEIVEFIRSEIGQETIDAFQIQFADDILAEASVGAVIRATVHLEGEEESNDVAIKIVKPYVLDSLPRELAIVDELALYFEEHSDSYGLGNIPLSDTFRDVRAALSSEIRIEDEQDNLDLAEAYYADNPEIRIPHLYPFSTPSVTVMDFISGVKITDAHLGEPAARREMARRLSDALTMDVMFSPKDEAIFHGDPHAGNVFHVSEDAEDAHRIALLDWGLYGSFPRIQREQLVQLVLGVYLGNTKRMRNNVGALIEETPGSPEDQQKIRDIVDEVIRNRTEIFPTLQNLTVKLATAGFQTRFNIALFVKSQITIAGILLELDPEFDQDARILGGATGLVWREFPKHMLNTLWFPAWNSHNYRSMLSNEDIRDIWTQRLGRVFKSLGSGMARALTAVF